MSSQIGRSVQMLLGQFIARAHTGFAVKHDQPLRAIACQTEVCAIDPGRSYLINAVHSSLTAACRAVQHHIWVIGIAGAVSDGELAAAASSTAATLDLTEAIGVRGLNVVPFLLSLGQPCPCCFDALLSCLHIKIGSLQLYSQVKPGILMLAVHATD